MAGLTVKLTATALLVANVGYCLVSSNAYRINKDYVHSREHESSEERTNHLRINREIDSFTTFTTIANNSNNLRNAPRPSSGRAIELSGDFIRNATDFIQSETDGTVNDEILELLEIPKSSRSLINDAIREFWRVETESELSRSIQMHTSSQEPQEPKLVLPPCEFNKTILIESINKVVDDDSADLIGDLVMRSKWAMDMDYRRVFVFTPGDITLYLIKVSSHRIRESVRIAGWDGLWRRSLQRDKGRPEQSSLLEP